MAATPGPALEETAIWLPGGSREARLEPVPVDPGWEAVLAHRIGFWNRHRDLLLAAPLEVRGVADGYAVVQARDEDVVVTARYAPIVLDVPAGDWTVWQVADAADGPLDVRGGGPVSVEIRDGAGGVVEAEHDVDLQLAALAVPTGGLLTVRRA